MAEHDAEFQEAQRIRMDPTHSEHERWEHGDPEIQEKVEAAYRKPYGTGERESVGSEVPEELKAVKERYEKGGPPVAGESGESPELEAVKQALRAQWGSEFEENFDLATRWVYETFQGREDLLDRIGEAIGDDAEAVKLALKLARRAR